jgi:SAM-dependent methyltransferase
MDPARPYLSGVNRRPTMNALQDTHTRALDCGTPSGTVVAHPAIVCRTTPDPDALAGRARTDVSDASAFSREAAAFVARRKLGPGLKVLDAATGPGDVAIAAARAGACVTAVDLAAPLLEAAAARARRERLAVRFQEGSVEDLPFDDGAFDVVLSMSDAMFAVHPGRVAQELARVTQPGGQVALALRPGAEAVGRYFDESLWEVATEPRREAGSSYLELVATRL